MTTSRKSVKNCSFPKLPRIGSNSVQRVVKKRDSQIILFVGHCVLFLPLSYNYGSGGKEKANQETTE